MNTTIITTGESSCFVYNLSNWKPWCFGKPIVVSMALQPQPLKHRKPVDVGKCSETATFTCFQISFAIQIALTKKIIFKQNDVLKPLITPDY